MAGRGDWTGLRGLLPQPPVVDALIKPHGANVLEPMQPSGRLPPGAASVTSAAVPMDHPVVFTWRLFLLHPINGEHEHQ